MVRWYLDTTDQAGRLPFYCDAERIGSFAVDPVRLAAGDEEAVFQLFITLSMYQALRDVVIMRRQRELPLAAVKRVVAVREITRAIALNGCEFLSEADSFEADCDVKKLGLAVDCGRWPGRSCHVKDATRVFHRMGDMGKLPTSAWLRYWKGGRLSGLLDEICASEPAPPRRAELLVERFARVHRVGRKLATLFVSALSTPSLAPGLTPWFPAIDGHELVVVDTNVARAVDLLAPRGASRNYEARVAWIRAQAARIDLREYRADLPRYSPRLVQEALYAYCSKSNRKARADACSLQTTPCPPCVRSLCPFGTAPR